MLLIFLLRYNRWANALAYLPCPGSWPWHCRWCRCSPPRGWWSSQSGSSRRSASCWTWMFSGLGGSCDCFGGGGGGACGVFIRGWGGGLGFGPREARRAGGVIWAVEIGQCVLLCGVSAHWMWCRAEIRHDASTDPLKGNFDSFSQ